MKRTFRTIITTLSLIYLFTSSSFAFTCTCNSALTMTPAVTDCSGGSFGTPSTITGNLSNGCLQSIYTECDQDENNTLWYQITTDPCAQLLLVDVDPGGNWQPQISVYEGNGCNDLTPLIYSGFPCGALVGPNVTFQHGVEPNTNYWIAVSSLDNIFYNDFTLEVSTTVNFITCLPSNQTDFAVDGNIVGGPNWDPTLPQNQLMPGQEYELCMDFLYDGTASAADWLHGIIPAFGPGWDMSSFEPDSASISPPSSTGPGGQNVDWYETVSLTESVPNICTFVNDAGNLELCNDLNQSCPCNAGMTIGDTLPPGWFWLSTGGNACTNDGIPANHWGIGSSTINIQICFNISVKEFDSETDCLDDNDLSISFMPFSDGVTGCWEDPQGECNADYAQFVTLRASCSDPQNFCFGDLDTALLADETNTSCILDSMHNRCVQLPAANSNPSGPALLCPKGGVAENIVWFSFVAPDVPLIEFLLTPYNCNSIGGASPGLQYGIYDSPDLSNAIICSHSCLPPSSLGPFNINLNAGEFIPGREYWFFLDGCSGSECSILVQLLEGTGAPIFEYPDPTDILCEQCQIEDSNPSGDITTVYAFCSSDAIELELMDAMGYYDNFNSSDAYKWTSTPSIPGMVSTTDDNMISLPSSVAAGVYTICASVSTDCNESESICIELIIENPLLAFNLSCDTDTPGIITFCWDDAGTENYVPQIETQSGNGSLNYDPSDNLLCCTVDNLNYNDSVALIITASNACTENTSTLSCVSDTCAQTMTFFLDTDNDGFGISSEFIDACALPSGYALSDGDCDDANALIYPGADELCDDIDNNCNDIIDEDVVFNTYYEDADGDDFGNPDVSVEDCQVPMGYVENNEDCDDANADINPNATEICDGTDNNCNDEIDEGLTLNTYYEDADGDDFGNPDVSVEDCQQPTGYVENNEDCDDTNTDINPDAVEIPNNGIDDDCDGLTATHELGNQRIDIFPNPTSSQLYIESSSDFKFTAQLYSLSGQLIIEANTSVLDVSAFTNGIYLLQIIDLNSGDRIVERIVVNR